MSTRTFITFYVGVLVTLSVIAITLGIEWQYVAGHLLIIILGILVGFNLPTIVKIIRQISGK